MALLYCIPILWSHDVIPQPVVSSAWLLPIKGHNWQCFDYLVFADVFVSFDPVMFTYIIECVQLPYPQKYPKMWKHMIF